MKREGFVSVWHGAFDDEDELFAYVEKVYPDGETSGSEFLRDIPIGFYDEDFAEICFVGAHDDRDRALNRVSFADGFMDAMREQIRGLQAAHSFYFIFDLDASSMRDRTGRLTFLGAFAYERRCPA